ncbi:MAG: FAD-dependent oxidoreductase, partial [Marinovum sp.]|nr:FAD-dependent oxidoreductase [Marinovum sp.]
NFAEMFPAWCKVEIEYDWSGLICLTRNLTPFVGPIQQMPGVYAGFGYHGNGVAMGSYAGALLADLALGAPQKRLYPKLFQKPPRRFPLGRYRRHLLRPIYSLMEFQDR